RPGRPGTGPNHPRARPRPPAPGRRTGRGAGRHRLGSGCPPGLANGSGADGGGAEGAPRTRRRRTAVTDGRRTTRDEREEAAMEGTTAQPTTPSSPTGEPSATTYVRDDAVHPPLWYPDYQSTRRRAPRRPLRMLPHTMTELTAPVFGEDRIGEFDHDLTRQHDGEP